MSVKEDLRKTMAELYAGLKSVPANEREQWLEKVRSMAYEGCRIRRSGPTARPMPINTGTRLSELS